MQNPQPPPAVNYAYVTPPSTGTKPNYAATTSRALGIVQVLLGVALIAIQIATFFLFCSRLMFLGHGIWTGIIVIVAGSFGIGASGNKSTCLIVTFLVMSIIAAVFMTIPIGLSAIVLSSYEDGSWCENDPKDSIAVDSLMLVAAVFEAIAAIWSSVICCKVLCCGNQANTVAQGQVVQYMQGRPGTVDAQQGNMVIAGAPDAYNTEIPMDKKSMSMNNY